MPTLTGPFGSAKDGSAGTDPQRGVVVGFDGSLASIAAVNSADVVTSKLGWPVHVVSVLPPMSAYEAIRANGSASQIEDLRVQLRDAAVRQIERDARRLVWTREVAVGEAPHEILRIAKDRDAQLILLGRSDHESLGARRGGSIAADVIDGSSIPVLLVEAELGEMQTAVAAVDFRLASIGAAAMALALLGDKGTLHLSYVDEWSSPTKTATAERHSENYPGEIEMLFARIIRQLKPPPGVVVLTTILKGEPAGAIVEFSESVHADFIAVGRRSLSPPARALLGSVSEKVVQAARFPLLIGPADTVTYGGAFA